MTKKLGPVIRALYDSCYYNSEEAECRQEMAEILRECGWHVAESNGDLRELALAETDLVEPE